MATASHAQAGAAQAAPAHKWLVALAVMLGTTLEVLDTSIVNVALPHMQGAFSAGVDEIAWVLTSYLVANGIMIPMTAWISSRFGRKRYFSDVGVCFRRSIGPVRRRTIAEPDDWLPPDSGSGRCGDDSVLPGHPDGDLSAR
jgi:Major Facilitator Superfamily